MCKDENAWVEAANQWIASGLADITTSPRMFLPAGETPRPLYRAWESIRAPFGSDVKLLQVDEVISGSGRGTFRRFFEENLPSFQSQFEYINEAGNGASLAILGLGTNGHVAFHEPNLPMSFYSGCVSLDRDTTSRLKIPTDSRAVTYGLGAFMRCRRILLIIRGESKRAILRDILSITSDRPAAHLKNHPALTILTDFEV